MLSEREKNDLARDHLGLARWHASRACHGDDFYEILSDALLGLTRAINSWSPDRGTTFATWASIKMRGEILEGKRNRDLLSRTQRRNGVTGIRPPLSLNVPTVGPEGDELSDLVEVLVDPASDRFDHVDVRALVNQLPARERFIVLAALEGIPRKDIAALLGLSDGRISQILRAVWLQLKPDVLAA